MNDNDSSLRRCIGTPDVMYNSFAQSFYMKLGLTFIPNLLYLRVNIHIEGKMHGIVSLRHSF
jgi:hypothetical protein